MELLDIQKYTVETINADAILADAGVEAVPEDLGDAFAKVNAAVAEVGICALVQLPRFSPTSSAAKNAVGNVTMQVVVAENPMTNRAQAGHLHALQAAERIAWILNLTKPVPADPLCDVLVLDGQGIVPQPQEDGEGLIVGVTFRCQHQLRGDPPTQTI